MALIKGRSAGLRSRMMTLRQSYYGLLIMALFLMTVGVYNLVPALLILVNSFNVNQFGQPASYSLDNWRAAYSDPALFQAVWNTFRVYWTYTIISFPTAVLIAWILGRTRIPFSHGLELGFWLSYILPGLATTIGWIYAFDPYIGVVNTAARWFPFIDGPIFNIYSVEGIVFAHLMGNAISTKVMLLTPAFRNMDAALEEAAHVSGANQMRTLFRVTLPVMIPPMVIVFMLNVVRIFNSFETELLLGAPANFFVFSTKIFSLIRLQVPPEIGQATALSAITMLVIFLIIPVQRWMLHRRLYTTVSGHMRPSLISLGRPWQPLANGFVIFVVILLVPVPLAILIGGSFMSRIGFFDFNPPFTLENWAIVLMDRDLLRALRMTLLLAVFAGVGSPIFFSTIAYVIARKRWAGRTALDALIWISAAIPGLLSTVGLLWLILGTPFLRPLFGSTFLLTVIVVWSGMLIGVQIFKANFLQVSAELEDAARVAGAGWVRTYLTIWMPVLMPSMIMIGVLNFVAAANTTTSIILLASRDTRTLSILVLEWMSTGDAARYEAGGIGSLIITAITMSVAIAARKYGFGLGIRYR